MTATVPSPGPSAEIPGHVVAVDDYEALARQRLSDQAWAWVSGGAADESTLRDNVAAFRRLRLKSRILRNVAGGDTRLNLCGQRLDYPILLAPLAFQKLLHPDGETATALAASAMAACMVLSTQSSVTLEDVAATAKGPRWFQIYLQADRALTADLVRRAEAAGYAALVVTVDAPVSGPRNREQRAGFRLPPGVTAANFQPGQLTAPSLARAGTSPVFGSTILSSAPSWSDIEWLQTQTALPLLLKGVLTAEDAATAADLGLAGVIVSNHGGRTLDGFPATIDALRGVVREVDERLPVLLDGGIRRGTDILKALALGASAVMIGRPFAYALAAAGASGVAHVLHLLRTELEIAMVLTGSRTLADIDSELLWPDGTRT